MSKEAMKQALEGAGDDWGLFQEYMPEIHRLVELVRADEREACANLVFHSPPYDEYESPLMAVYNAIRARSST